jgi:hypothetical protein
MVQATGGAVLRHVRQSTASRGLSCFYVSMPLRLREFSMFTGALIPNCPAAFRCALMLAGAVSIIFFSGDLVQFAVAGTF